MTMQAAALAEHVVSVEHMGEDGENGENGNAG